MRNATGKAYSGWTMGVCLAALLASFSAYAETISGKINGLQCAVSGFVCPIDQIDAMVALESDFVLQKADGAYYTMTNLDRSIKARYALKEVTVSGTVNEFYKVVEVDSLQVGGKTVWSKKMQADLEESFRKRLYTD